MHLAPTDISQQTLLAYMRHQDLLADAQRRRMIEQSTPAHVSRRRVAAWRRWLGQRLITWGHALQASRPQPTAVRGPMFAPAIYARHTTNANPTLIKSVRVVAPRPKLQST